MYADRETGGFAGRKNTTADTENSAKATAPAAEILAPETAKDKPPQPVRLPVTIEAPATGARKSRARKILLLGAVALAVAGGAGTYGHHWWTVGRFIESTDDAYVGAHNTTLAAKVAGYISTIAVEDNTQVHAGDVIATIDDGDFRLAVDSARDKVATQQATIDRIGRQIIAQRASVDQGKAQLASAQAGSTRAQLEF